MPEIITFSESLKMSSQPATIEEAPEIIAKLEETLKMHRNGIGLSAIQIGIPKRIFIIIVEGDNGEDSFMHFINPEVVKQANPFTFQGEGCLSYPGLYLDTTRYQDYIVKRGLIDKDGFREEEIYCHCDPNGNHSDTMLCVGVQHEMEHLDGRVLPMYGKEKPDIAPKKDKIGRNDKCPCGSSKKYKKCCMGKN